MFKRSFTAVSVALVLAGASAWAGDTSSYVDLGFSADGSRYMFAQYGVEAGSLKPWAELFVVDVPRNVFVQDGKRSFAHDAPVVAGQDGSGAFYKLLAEGSELAAVNKVDFLRQSQPLYLGLDVGEPVNGGGGAIEFRDFESGASYVASLVPYVEGSGAGLRSSFFINVERTAKDGAITKHTVGTPAFKRPLVSAYRIKRALIAPKDGSLIFVVEMWKQGPKGSDLRYMVEALKL